MTTTQIITIAILVILAVISYFKVPTTKNEKTKILFSVLWMFITGLFIFLTCDLLIELNTANQLLKDKCPQYEKVENVYRLKETQ